ncbi:MAG: GntR family transcriptional regulator [Propionibacteriaceae bacterium]|nr:GntR family transcriptional regulator [Propionibacteriaceae bacterium]
MPRSQAAFPPSLPWLGGNVVATTGRGRWYPDPVPPKTGAVNRLTLREQVLENLREAIVTGGFRPGTILTETELADRYEVSRGTVREALRTLQNAGLITGDARGTLRVHVPDDREIAEIYRVRAALESLALREIIASPQRNDFAERLRAALPPAGGELSFIDALDIDLAFHEELCRLSGNSILLVTWKRLEDQMRVVLLSSGRTEPLDLMGHAHHAPIVDAIDHADLDEATALIYQHMDIAAGQWTADWRARAS